MLDASLKLKQPALLTGCFVLKRIDEYQGIYSKLYLKIPPLHDPLYLGFVFFRFLFSFFLFGRF